MCRVNNNSSLVEHVLISKDVGKMLVNLSGRGYKEEVEKHRSIEIAVHAHSLHGFVVVHLPRNRRSAGCSSSETRRCWSRRENFWDGRVLCIVCFCFAYTFLTQYPRHFRPLNVSTRSHIESCVAFSLKLFFFHERIATRFYTTKRRL